LEPENNIETILKGYLLSDRETHCPLIVIGKTDTPHGKYLVGKYGGEKSVRFVGGIYDFDKLNSLRHFSSAYFHGHSVGGTNPSLLEAMASGCFIVAGDNVFNKSVLYDDALYFSSDADVCAIINSLEVETKAKRNIFVANNLERIRTAYSWEKLTDEHEQYFLEILKYK
jgi:glycosyltransferase involved in cell wall biosynthesis